MVRLRDEAANRTAMVTDVRAGSVRVPRHLWGEGDTWEAEDPEKATITERPDGRARKEAPRGGES
ncbi:hypothetical protein ACF07V_34820 [Streptomyces sp. NPDC015661]|uniref:hypothetical protein n=1 Tax=Streptomyces sp. NPDC015661 TaxID=3364961 RepID=UPI0036F62E3F